jgi:hypothetical protein
MMNNANTQELRKLPPRLMPYLPYVRVVHGNGVLVAVRLFSFYYDS